MYEKTRFVSGVSSAPPSRTASAPSPTSSIPSRSCDERVHRQREDALAAERPDGGAGGGLDLVSSSLDAVRLELLGELRLRPGRRVRHEPQPVAVRAQTAYRVGGAGDRFAGNVQNTVDVEQNRSHDRFRVYSGHEERRRSASRRSSCGRRARAAPAASMRRSPRPGSRRCSTSRRRRRSPTRRSGASSRRPGRCSARSRRTSAASCGTASSRPSGSSPRCARRSSSSGVASRRSRPRPRRRGASTTKKRRGEVEAVTPAATRLRNAACASFARGRARSGTRRSRARRPRTRRAPRRCRRLPSARP